MASDEILAVAPISDSLRPSRSKIHRFLISHRVGLLALLFVAFAFVPFLLLRYEYHDSWALLWYSRSIEVFNPPTTCLETGSYHAMTGRFMMMPIICGMLSLGAIIDLVWIPKLMALLTLFAAGGILLAVFRRVGVNAVLASVALISLLMLPGMTFTVVWMATNPVAYAVFASVLAGYLWLRYLRHPKHRFTIRFALSVCVFALLVLSFFIYHVVALFFFVPLMIELLFSRQEKGAAQLLYPVLAVATFAFAAISYVAIHKVLLYEFHYFFLTDRQVAHTLTDDRSLSITGILELGGKLRFFASVLLPQVLTLWFTSETAHVCEVAATLFGAVSVISIGLFAWRSQNIWRFLALLLIASCFFGPFLASANISNGLYTNERVKFSMQLPIVLLAWWLVHLLATTFSRIGGRAAAGILAASIVVGIVASWLMVLRTRVIPNYMELKHVEYRLKEAIRQNVREIYIIKSDDRHLRGVFGNNGGREEIGRITSFYFPEHMVYALLVQMKGRSAIPRVVGVEAGKGDTVKPEIGRLILDMRRFP